VSVTDDRELERLVEIVADRVRARLAVVPEPRRSDGARAGVPGRGDCLDDEAPGEDCGECGACVVRRPWSVRAMEDAGASRVAVLPGAGTVPGDMAALIDHTLLKPDATREEVRKLCEEAKTYRFASVCVNTTWVPMCRAALRGSGVKVCTVVGFPLGAMAPTAKAYEARDAVRQGADEIDMVINIGALKSRDYETVFEDICRVVKASRPAIVKVILETGSLTPEEKIVGCAMARLAGAAFVKTSTGFGKGGATVEDIALMRKVVGADMGVKASGGVRSAEDAAKMALAGANRIGASASVAIVTGAGGGGGGGATAAGAPRRAGGAY
jgi:deoxyribose-phosphate aldolase